VDFEPERSDGDARPDGWTDDGGPESVRSLMFHSNDDLPWPAEDPDVAETAADDDDGDVRATAIPIQPDTPDRPSDGEPVPEDLMDAPTQRTESQAAGGQDHPAPTFPAAPAGWSDTITSTDGPHYWDRLMSSERDRVRRYRRPATVVFLEVEHLDRLSELWGEDVAAQSLVRIGRTVMRQIRSSDHCARIDTSRFAVFLPETDEIAAINFVERIRASMEESLGLMADTIHVAIGWASPTDGNLDSALELAQSRLVADLAASA
jgi:diguanylate cyclase (GGDEF)-like protein